MLPKISNFIKTVNFTLEPETLESWSKAQKTQIFTICFTVRSYKKC